MEYEHLSYQQNGVTCGPVCQTLILMMICLTRRQKKKNIELGTCLLKLVDRVLLHDSAHIQKLHLSFDMPVRLIRPYLWVKFAVMRNVQELDLSLPVNTTFFCTLAFLLLNH